MHTQIRLTCALIVFPFSGLLGCGTDSVGCTLEARSSVMVKVVDAMGAPVTDAMVTFSHEGGAAENCENLLMDGSYTCGYERDGAITVTATKGADTKMQTVTVSKTEDGCHVVGQSITLTLGA